MYEATYGNGDVMQQVFNKPDEKIIAFVRKIKEVMFIMHQ